MAGKQERFPLSVIIPIAIGNFLNPLNSSMISVALVVIASDFQVSATTVTWVISAFYLVSCVGQPLMGRFADRFGPRRVFILGMSLVVISGIVGPFAPSITVLVLVRMLQSLGTSAGFPSAVAVIRSLAASRSVDVQSGLTIVATVNLLGAAIGPFVGGIFLLLGGWQALFWINIPLGLVAIVGAWLWVPHDAAPERPTMRAVLAGSDAIGVIAFSGFVVALLMFVISWAASVQYWLLPVCVVSAVIFLWQENRSPVAFINVRMLRRNGALLGVYLHFILFCVVFYCAIYGLPQWLEVSVGFTPAQIGLLIFPLALMGGLLTPVASWLIRKRGLRFTLVVGGVLGCVGCVGVLLLDQVDAIWFVLLVCAVLGVPNAIMNLGLQTRMYKVAPSPELGTAAGLFQTSRFLGGILSMGILGIVFSQGINDAAFQAMAIAMLVVAFVVLGLCLRKVPADAKAQS